MPRSGDAQIWADYAEQDFRAMTALLASPDPVYPIACFLAQQAVEKYLKALLVFHGIDPQRSHDLNALRKECALLHPVLAGFALECAELNTFSVSPSLSNGHAAPRRVRDNARSLCCTTYPCRYSPTYRNVTCPTSNAV